MVRSAALIVLLVSTSASAQEVPELLMCRGTTIAPVQDGNESIVLTDNSGNVVTGSSNRTTTREVEMVVQFRLRGDDPRANLPRFAAPQIASSKGGWYRIKDLETTNDRITGKVVFNIFNSSKFEIDRRTAILTTEAGFQATCEKVEIGENAF